MTITGGSVQDSSPRRSTRTTRRRLLAGVGAVVVAAGILGGCISADQATVQNLINADRTKAGRSALVDHSAADAKAQAWAQKMADQGRIFHSTLTDGYNGVCWNALGENVGMGPSLESLQVAFMNSTGHRANILNPVYDHVGSGVVKKGSTYYVVQEFADIC